MGFSRDASRSRGFRGKCFRVGKINRFGAKFDLFSAKFDLFSSKLVLLPGLKPLAVEGASGGSGEPTKISARLIAQSRVSGNLFRKSRLVFPSRDLGLRQHKPRIRGQFRGQSQTSPITT